MTVRIRLQRFGAKKRPFYRVVAADIRAPRDGRFIELLGTFDPLLDPPLIRLKKDRVDYWLSVGAQPSDKARSLINRLNAGEGINLSEEGADAASRELLRAKKQQDIATKRAEAAKAPTPEAPKAEEAAEAPAEEKTEEG